MSNGFDRKAQQALAATEDEGTVVHVRGVDEQPCFHKPPGAEAERAVTWTVVGVNSRQHRRIEQELRTRKLKPASMTAGAFYADSIEKAAACTVGFDGFYDDGIPVEFNRHNAREILKEFPSLLEQVTEAMNDHARFSLSSSPQQ